MSITKICRTTGAQFTVTDEDREFLNKAAPMFRGKRCELPDPTLSPKLRAMRRMAWRNSNHLYRRKCDQTGAPIISAYPAEAPYPIYSTQAWWGDGWDALSSGREYDFTRPFFAQFQELQLCAPRPAMMNRESENSEYCNYAGQNKNCHMANNGSWYNDNCQLGEAFLRSRDSVDCNYLRGSELCYEVRGGEKLYECAFVLDSYHSASCFFSFNLRSCTNCFLCCNLRNKTGYILSKPASKAELAVLRSRMRTRAGRAELEAEFRRLMQESVRPAAQLINCEESSGDYLANCKNVRESFMVGTIRDGKYLLHCDEGQDMWDCSLSGYGQSELYYETVSSGDGGTRALFCSGSWSSSDVIYCDTVMSCNSCFGCVGLKRQEYCILNRQYSKPEYESLVPRIIEHMRHTEEWGEFFPEKIAPHAYNECHAADFYPLTKAEALSLGYRWNREQQAPPPTDVTRFPESINDTPDEICSQVLVCKESGKQYRIIGPELELLRKIGIAPPELAPETRRKLRNALRNAPQLYQQNCCIQGEPIVTSFLPSRNAKVCCQPCYLSLLE